MRPTRRGQRVGRLSSRKPVKSMPKIYDPSPRGSVNYQPGPWSIFVGNCTTLFYACLTFHLYTRYMYVFQESNWEARYRRDQFETRATYLL